MIVAARINKETKHVKFVLDGALLFTDGTYIYSEQYKWYPEQDRGTFRSGNRAMGYGAPYTKLIQYGYHKETNQCIVLIKHK